MFNKTTEGLVKAWGYIAQANARAQQKAAERKLDVEPWATAIHASRCVTPTERLEVDVVVAGIKAAKGNPELRDRLFADLARLPTKRVSVYFQAPKADRSRYTGADIRRINATGGGPKEKARAAKRAAATFIPVAIAA